MPTSSTFSKCFEASLLASKQKRPATFRSYGPSRSSLPSVHLCCYKGLAIRCSSYQDDFKAAEQSASPFTPSELRLPLASPPSSDASENEGADERELEEEEEEEEKASVASAPGVSSEAEVAPQASLFGAATKAIEELTATQLALYGGLLIGGVFFVEAILNSFEALPLLPETLQFVGVLYSILLASRIFRGKSVTFTPSPIKAITELVERGGNKIQKTSLVFPEDLDARILATLENLTRERDDAVNEAETLRTKVTNYVRILAEKEALEAVSVQLAQERDEAISEVVSLKQAVDAMSQRMRSFEKTLQQELEPLKQSTRALETVALQLASERDSALNELSEIKKELDLVKCKEEERIALESLALQLVEERDQASAENETLKKKLEDMQRVTVTGMSAEKDLSMNAHIDAAGSQYTDLDNLLGNEQRVTMTRMSDEKDLSMNAHIDAAGSQYTDLDNLLGNEQRVTMTGMSAEKDPSMNAHIDAAGSQYTDPDNLLGNESKQVDTFVPQGSPSLQENDQA